MDINKKIQAFTLLEFSISMTISTTVIGLMLLSFFYMVKWNHNYYNSLLENEGIYEIATLLKQDMNRFPDAVFDKPVLVFEENGSKVVYNFDKSMISRTIGSVTDTFYIKEVIVDPIYANDTTLLLFLLDVKLITQVSDTFKFDLSTSRSIKTELRLSHASRH